MVIDRELIPHHSDDIGPAIDGDAGQTAHILARFIKVPRAVVVPAVIQEALRKLIRFVVVIDVERGQIQNVALVHGVKGNRLVGGLHVAVAVDNHLYDLLLRGVGHIDVGPAVDSISFRELIPSAVGIPLEPLVVGVAVAIQVFDIFFQIVDHVFTVEGLTGIQHIVISLHAVGDAIDHHALIVGDHADDVGPAADGDSPAQRVVGVAGLVIIPAAVVVPALEHIVLAGHSTLSVVVRDIQARNTNGIADFVIPHYRNRCIGCGGIAIAIDDYIDSLILRGIFHIVQSQGQTVHRVSAYCRCRHRTRRHCSGVTFIIGVPVIALGNCIDCTPNLSIQRELRLLQRCASIGIDQIVLNPINCCLRVNRLRGNACFCPSPGDGNIFCSHLAIAWICPPTKGVHITLIVGRFGFTCVRGIYLIRYPFSYGLALRNLSLASIFQRSTFRQAGPAVLHNVSILSVVQFQGQAVHRVSAYCRCRHCTRRHCSGVTFIIGVPVIALGNCIDCTPNLSIQRELRLLQRCASIGIDQIVLNPINCCLRVNRLRGNACFCPSPGDGNIFCSHLAIAWICPPTKGVHITLIVGRFGLACVRGINYIFLALDICSACWQTDIQAFRKFTPTICHRIRGYRRSGRLLQCSRLTRLSPLCIRAKGRRFVGRVRMLSLKPTRVVQIGLDGEGNDQFISAVSGFTRVRGYCCSVFSVIKAGNFDYTRLFIDCNANLIGQFLVIRASPQISSVLINARKRKDLNGYPRAIRFYSISEGEHFRHGVGQRSLLSRDNVQGILDIILDLLEHRVQLFRTAGRHVVIPGGRTITQNQGTPAAL